MALTLPPVPTSVPMYDKNNKMSYKWKLWWDIVYKRIGGATSGFAPDSASYITNVPEAGLTAEQALSTMSSGFVKVTTGTGALSSTGNTLIQATDLANTAVTAGTYTVNGYTVFTVDAQGRLTNAASPTLTKSDVGLGSVENTALSTWAGSTNITTLGTITTGTWTGTTIAVANGGTGQTSYTNGQLLIGNTTGNTLTKTTLTGTANQVVVTNGSGSITLSTPQDIGTGSTPTFAAINLGNTNLSDYVESTWAPTITLVGGAGNTVPQYATTTAKYTRIGRLVYVDLTFNGDGGNEGAGTGTFNFDLPIAAAATTTNNYVVMGTAFNTTGVRYLVVGFLTASSTAVGLGYFNAINTIAAFTGADQNNTSRNVNLKFFYEV